MTAFFTRNAFKWTFLSDVWILLTQFNRVFCDILLLLTKRGFDITLLSGSNRPKSLSYWKCSEEGEENHYLCVLGCYVAQLDWLNEAVETNCPKKKVIFTTMMNPMAHVLCTLQTFISRRLFQVPKPKWLAGQRFALNEEVKAEQK